MTTLNEIKPAAPAEASDGGRCAVDAGSVWQRCGDCKYWNRWDHNVGTCDQLTLGLRSGRTTKGHDRCRVYDDSDPITTEINFGCIHFSPNIVVRDGPLGGRSL